MASDPCVILYQYEASPFAQKIFNVLTLKGIEHKRVEVSRMPPRPALSKQLAISYRRIPVLAIGRDVFVDTSLIVNALERRFPASAGFGTVYPDRKGGSGRDTGLIKALATFYADRTVFPLATMLLPWDTLPEAFVKDRSSYKGSPIDTQRIVAAQPTFASAFRSHLSLIEEQLADDREWLMDTQGPSYADISLHFIVTWISRLPAAQLLYINKFPKFVAWLDRMSVLLSEKGKSGSGKYTNISGEDAGRLIVSSSYEPAVEFDVQEAQTFGLSRRDTVLVTPDDTGRDGPTEGVLIGITIDEVVIETTGDSGVVRVHFPRLGFGLRPATQDSKL